MIVKITKGLFLIVVLELILGGGRLISFGPVSLRMILFSLSIGVSLLLIIKGERIPVKYSYLIMVYTLMLLAGSWVGFARGGDLKLIWEDVKPLLFFYLLPFFHFTITNKGDVVRISKIIMTCSVILAITFITIIFLMAIDIIPFLDFYRITASTDEFFYRGEYTFFYKGFIYLCIGFIFFHMLHSKEKWWWLLLLAVAIMLTFTRGLILALCLVYIMHYFNKRNYFKVAIVTLVSAAILLYGRYIYSTVSKSLYTITVNETLKSKPALSGKLLGDREYSDNERKAQILQVVDSVTFISALIGHGFGNGVSSRPVHMEISYLEIFHKQGISGILCWGFIFSCLVVSYRNAKKYSPTLAHTFFYSSLFVFFQSLTNQYMNNPIGLGMIMLSQVSLDQLATSK